MEQKERTELEKKIYFEILTLQQNISEALELKDEKLMRKKLKFCKINASILEKNVSGIFSHEIDSNSKKMMKKIIQFGLTDELLNFIKSGEI